MTEEDDAILEGLIDPALTPEEELSDYQAREQLRALINSLPPTQQQVLRLYYFDNMTQARIAKIMEISQPRVSGLIATALVALQHHINKSDFEL